MADIPPWFAIIAAILVAVIVLLGGILIIQARNDDDSIATADSSTTTTEPPSESDSVPAETSTSVDDGATTTSSTEDSTTSTTAEATTTSTTAESTTTSEAATTTTLDPALFETAVWPWADSSTRYTDPVAAATGFATDFVGFTNPVVGAFQAGDARSGEVEVQPQANGPVTVVFVRQLGPNDTWWVLGAATENIAISEPSALDTVSSPLTIKGQSLAFEGSVDVEVRPDGTLSPIVKSFVTGGGVEVAPFEGTFTWSTDPGSAGAVVLFTESAENGQVWEAAVVRVKF